MTCLRKPPRRTWSISRPGAGVPLRLLFCGYPIRKKTKVLPRQRQKQERRRRWKQKWRQKRQKKRERRKARHARAVTIRDALRDALCNFSLHPPLPYHLGAVRGLAAIAHAQTHHPPPLFLRNDPPDGSAGPYEPAAALLTVRGLPHIIICNNRITTSQVEGVG
jgi:hypothetical protein